MTGADTGFQKRGPGKLLNTVHSRPGFAHMCATFFPLFLNFGEGGGGVLSGSAPP